MRLHHVIEILNIHLKRHDNAHSNELDFVCITRK